MCLCVFKEYSRSMDGYYSSQCQDRYFHVSSWPEKDQRHLNNSEYCLCLSLKQLENILGLLEEQNPLEDILVWIIIIKNLCVCLYPCLCLSLCLFLPFSSLCENFIPSVWLISTPIHSPQGTQWQTKIRFHQSSPWRINERQNCIQLAVRSSWAFMWGYKKPSPNASLSEGISAIHKPNCDFFFKWA